jgi:MFS family permease
MSAMALLANRDLTLYLVGRAAGTLAVLMQSVAVGWQVYDVTRDPVSLGWVGLAQFLPMLALTVPAGDLADRLDRRYLVAFSSLLQVLCSLLLIAITWTADPAAWWFYASLAIYGVGRAIAAPAARSFIPQLVTDEDLPAAYALSATTFQVAVIAGPALGGLLYLLGPLAVYGACTVLALFTVFCFAAIHTRPTASPLAGTAWSRVSDGISFMRSSPIVLGAISLDLFAVLLGGAVALLPVFAADVLHVGSVGLGAMRSAPAIGALLVNGWLMRSPPQRRVGVWMMGGVGVFGVATVAFGLSTNLWLSLVCLAVMGGSDMVSVWVRSTLVPLATPRGMLGRVSAVEMLFVGASNELGEFESGMTAGWFGTVPAVLFGGVGTLVVTGVWWVVFPALRRVDRFADLSPASAASEPAEAKP